MLSVSALQPASCMVRYFLCPPLQAVNSPIPVALSPPSDGPPGDALEVGVQQGNPQAEVGSGLDGAPAPPPPRPPPLLQFVATGRPSGGTFTLLHCHPDQGSAGGSGRIQGQGPCTDRSWRIPAQERPQPTCSQRPRLQERQWILTPSDSALTCRHLAACARMSALARHDRRRVPASEALICRHLAACARMSALATHGRLSLRESWVTYIPYQQGKWWFLLRA